MYSYASITIPVVEGLEFTSRTARDPSTGKTLSVPGNMAYEQWKKGLETSGNADGVGGILGEDENRKIETTRFKLKGTNYSDDYAQKLMNVYSTLKENGYEATEHSLNRILGRISQGKISSVDTVLETLRTGDRYRDRNTNETIIYYNKIAIAFAKDGVIKTVIGNSKIKDDWEKIE